MKVSHTSTHAAPMDRVVQALCGEPFNVACERRREGVIATTYHPVERTDQRVVFEMHTQEYKRTKTGGLDRSETTDTILRFEYSAARNGLTWTYRNARGGGRLKLGGTYTLAPAGDGVRLTHEVEVEVDIPLVGKKISQFVAKQFEKELPHYDRLLAEQLR